jgi:hypothetical protein
MVDYNFQEKTPKQGNFWAIFRSEKITQDLLLIFSVLKCFVKSDLHARPAN